MYCSIKKIHLNDKKRLIQTYILGVVIYGCETWIIHDIEKIKIRSWHMEGISWIKRNANEEVLITVKEKRTLMNTIRARH